MEMCKAPKNFIQKNKYVYIYKFSSIIMQKMHTNTDKHTHTHTHTHIPIQFAEQQHAHAEMQQPGEPSYRGDIYLCRAFKGPLCFGNAMSEHAFFRFG